MNGTRAAAAVLSTAAGDGTIAPGDTLAVRFAARRGGPVQVVALSGPANGTFRLRYRWSAWTAALPADAPAAAVKAALEALDVAGARDVAVGRADGAGPAWRVTFFGGHGDDDPRARPLLGATAVFAADDRGAPDAPSVVGDVAAVLGGARQLGAALDAAWTAPDTLTVTVVDAAGAAAPADVVAGRLAFVPRVSLTDRRGTWVPGREAINNTWRAATCGRRVEV
ncbi:hypothetical protein AURANDRAFT_67038 [Aureococcus anophagefferens]|uniref:Uncharacterized protein n=1 Tax=Aureococcus anophagefferens TaxID=44056 RepID=F0YJQ9_AURAN|nr:hypothetical protein AURANDRAFT_67038 [Aureococcus anophagefferens]EGB04697.1 hypothetical protein AURANDRAFT_67038 [Aureococcus anophagefferens]|eukprot:XP_009040611.1 hypothetical protein AURANDRAFT_67038 [Aureococcus anophagefferens]